MIADWDTDTVLVSNLLFEQHPGIARQMEVVLAVQGIHILRVRNMADIWIRDAAPVQVGDREFIQFRYQPDYLEGKYEHLLTRPKVFRELDFIKHRRGTHLIIDGGNVVGTRSGAVLTEKIFKENPRWSRNEIVSKLRRLLTVKTLVVVPKEPYDRIGHTDGMIRFVSEDHAIINDYTQIDSQFAERLEAVLISNRIRFTRIPYVPERRSRDGISSAVGNYSNYLRVGNVMLVPAYGIPEDRKSHKIMLKLFPECTVTSIQCRELAERGGALNCASWTIRIKQLSSIGKV